MKIQNMREYIKSQGGEFLFNQKVTDFEFKNNHSKTAQEFYNAFYDQMTNQKQKDYINLVINYKTDKKAKKELLNKKEVFNSMPPFLRRLLRYSIKHDKY